MINFLGGVSGLYSVVSCAVAKMQGTDDIVNSAISGAVTGLAVGLVGMFTPGYSVKSLLLIIQ